MTNAEKFKQVFGIDFEEFEKEDLKCKYSKLKKYKATLASWRFNREPLTIYVNAPNKTQARTKAKDIFGEDYECFLGSGAPCYKIEIEKC